jgi:hypothetical protein
MGLYKLRLLQVPGIGDPALLVGQETLVEVLLSGNVPLADSVWLPAIALECERNVKPSQSPTNGEPAEEPHNIGSGGCSTHGKLHLLGLAFDSLVKIGLLLAKSVSQVVVDPLMMTRQYIY